MAEKNRREFLVATGCTLATAGLWGQVSSKSTAWKLVANTDRKRILDAAEQYLAEPVTTITAFTAKRSAGGIHDFYSQADYFWPDPKNPNGPYVNRDGQSNPDNFNDHRKVMVALSIQVPALTAAWLLTRKEIYSLKALDHLRAWFVTPTTRMNPNLAYAQAIQGLNTGRSIGIIDTLHLVEVARAASHLIEGKAIRRSEDAAGIRDWFRSYLDWLMTSAFGRQERDTKNNHSMCWALQAAEFARLTENETARKEIYKLFREVQLPGQMGLDGSFPLELARTKPYSYSIFNFDVMAGLCQSLKGISPNPTTFQLPDGRGLCKAAEFIYPYIKDKSTWKWTKDIEHFDALPVRSPGLLFAGLACGNSKLIDLWKTLNPDPTDREVIRNYPIRQPLLWVG